MFVAGGGTEGSDTDKEGWMTTEEWPHPHRDLAKTDAGEVGRGKGAGEHTFVEKASICCIHLY